MERELAAQRRGAPDCDRESLVLRLYPDTVLRESCAPVTRFDSSLRDFAEDMHRLMRRYGGIGLAAPQVGIPQRIIVADIGGGRVSIVNPEILVCAGTDVLTEGCLSLPGRQIDVRRAWQIQMTGRDLEGRAVRSAFSGLLARVLQHEVDHLDGVLIIDYVESLLPVRKDSYADHTQARSLRTSAPRIRIKEETRG